MRTSPPPAWRDEAVKLLHHLGFGEHWQSVQWGIVEPSVELLIERRVLVDVLAQAVHHAVLMRFQLLSVPAIL